LKYRPAEPTGDESNSMPSRARGWADDALRIYLSDPAAAGDLAGRARAAAAAERNWSAASIAERTLGLIAGHLSDSDAAQRHLRAAIRFGQRALDPVSIGRARLDLAYVLVRCGRSVSALHQIAAAEPDLPDAEARSLLQMRALVFKSLGRLDEAMSSYASALPLTRAAGDERELAVLLGNRGVLHLYRGETDLAERDLLEADAVFAALGADLSRAIMAHNLGYTAALRGDVPLALRRYDDAEAGYARHREVPLELWRDRCELLLQAGLAAEAMAAAERAMQAAASRREPAELAEAQLRFAQASLAHGEPAEALRVATVAAQALVRQRRSTWVALARWTMQRARMAGDATSVGDTALRRSAARLEAAGWRGAALEARLEAAQVALAGGRILLARRDLEIVGRARSTGPMWHRQVGWHAEALLRVGRGDRSGALRAAARGLEIVDEHRATLGATDLRAGASRRVSALAALGMELAADGGRPNTVLRWAERTRAAALLRPAATPPDDEHVRRILGELRYVVRQRQDAVIAGHPAQSQLRRQVQLEEQVRRLVRQADGSESAARTRVDVAAVGQSLGDRVLVEFARVRGQLLAVVVAAKQIRTRWLGEIDPMVAQLDHLLFALRRMSAIRPGTRGGRRALLLAAADWLDRMLLAPLADVIGDRAMVVVPTDPLHRLPWAVLPSCRGRPVSVCPSATLWRMVDAAGPLVAPERPLLVAGPGLAHAVSEVRSISEQYSTPNVLAAADAQVGTVLEAIADADLVHFAAHGRFRSDNPLFSAIELADGPLTGYDVERLPQGPARAVLSACETGRSAAWAGGEVLGLAATLLSIGVRSVVAPLLPISDAETIPLMQGLHRGLRAGLTTSEALASAAQTESEGEDPRLAAAVSFAAIGI